MISKLNLLSKMTIDDLENVLPRFLVRLVKAILIYLYKFVGIRVKKIFLSKFDLIIDTILVSHYVDKLKDSEIRPNSNTLKQFEHFKLDTYYQFNKSKSLNYLKDSMLNPLANPNLFKSHLDWAFWNLDFSSNIEVLNYALFGLNRDSKNYNFESKRYLPQFTTNMGHLGCLTYYLSFYADFDPNREIVLWPDLSPNKFYIELLIDQSPIKILTLPNRDKIKSLNILDVDTLLYSKKSDIEWRLEFSSSTYSGQSFPEIEPQNRFKLNFPEKEVDRCVNILEQIGFDPNKWFVVLHLRQTSKNLKNHAQSRDSEISAYKEFIKTIYDLGGQVIRMGNTSFPKLEYSSPAIDYAHSEIKSDVIDCFLWSHCRWWTGNSNGAASAAYAFGAIRLITDQWHWSNVGPEFDYFIPKALFKGERQLSISETIHSDVGRQMYVSKLDKKGFALKSPTSSHLASAALDLYRSTQPCAKSSTKFMQLEVEINSQLRNIHRAQTMRIPPSFEHGITI